MEEIPFAAMVMLAIAFRIMASPLETLPSPIAPRLVGGAFLVLYFIQCVAEKSNDVNYLLLSFGRSLVGYEVIRSTMVVLHAGWTVLNVRWRHQQDERRRRTEERLRKKMEEPAPKPIQVEAPRVPRSERLRKAANEANEAYREEIAALESLPLDVDERFVLAQRAKQRLLKKLNDLQRR